MNDSLLFTHYKLKGLQLKNRIAMAPMCQYSSDNTGSILDWHRIHYISRAIGQVGMIITEARMNQLASVIAVLRVIGYADMGGPF